MKARFARRQEASRAGGFALVLSLVVVTVVTGLCAGFVQLAASTARTQSESVDQLRAFYLAEAGLAEAFLAVRMGRTGGIGTEELPAKYGDGYVFVESMRTMDARVWLRATSRVGRGRAVLGLVVQPEKPPLGFFAEEQVVIEATLHADGFDSTTRSYEDEILATHSPVSGEGNGEEDEVTEGFSVDPESPYWLGQREAHYFAGVMGTAELLSVIENQVMFTRETYSNGVTESTQWFINDSPISVTEALSGSEYTRFTGSLPAIFRAMEAGALTALSDHAPANTTLAESWLRDNFFLSSVLDVEGVSRDLQTMARSAGSSSSDGSTQTNESIPLLTERGAAIGSNGDIVFLDSANTLVNGSVTPGTNGSVTGLPSGLVAGSTDSRALDAELDPVVVPAIVGTKKLVHSTAIPHVIGEGESGFETLQVADGAEVVIRGPATVRIHDLRLDGGSTLSLDTRDGNVELFVTGDLSMDPASFLETTAVTSKEVSIVAGTLPDQPPPDLMIQGNSKFHGTVYAPESTVRIGTMFEVFGSISAKRLEVAAGARLHFDDESYNGELPVPLQESWQIIELPTGSGQPVKPTAEMLAADISLAAAHNLDDVNLSIRYTDTGGLTQTYAGPESDFDWDAVASVEAETRVIAMSEADAEEAFADAAVANAADPAGVTDAAALDSDSARRGARGLWSAVPSFAAAWLKARWNVASGDAR